MKLHAFSSMVLCLKQDKEERWKVADNCTECTQYWVRDVTERSLDTNQNGRCLIENRASRHLWFKTYLRYLINGRTHNSSSILQKSKKHILGHKCIRVQPSQLQSYFTAAYCLHRTCLHAITLRCRTKLARIAHPKNFTVSCTPFLP